MKRIAIIDDEADARQALRTMLASFCPEVEVCAEAGSVESAYMLIRNSQPHALLLDISLDGGTGFDLLDKFPHPTFQVIFTTAHDEFAIKAFRYHALDYLLKPINPMELAQAIDRISVKIPDDLATRMEHLIESARTRKIEKMTLSGSEGIVFLPVNQISHLESDGSYTTFFMMSNERHLIAKPMREFEELLPENQFFKIHQSHMVNLAYVKKILREDGGYALMENGSKVPIARRRKDEFLEQVRLQFRFPPTNPAPF
ncbi:MAG TPA: LytTR family DNA-binding domain-containing protein [Saprospiraceae bacterium]|nr:LytTR family DNA-binding domain-containing protein [Saprospiraceae bacterium]HMQ82940.1 LytTR family DNA-binding domain-containing protein [Saprospiraceae bacterium]